MKQIDVGDLIRKLNVIAAETTEIIQLIDQPNIIIADFPSPEKKARKKRVKKEKKDFVGEHFTSGLPTSAKTEKPKRGRRARHIFSEPALRPGETPV